MAEARVSLESVGSGLPLVQNNPHTTAAHPEWLLLKSPQSLKPENMLHGQGDLVDVIKGFEMERFPAGLGRLRCNHKGPSQWKEEGGESESEMYWQSAGQSSGIACYGDGRWTWARKAGRLQKEEKTRTIFPSRTSKKNSDLLTPGF